MKLIHIFICCIFVFLFHGKMLGESILAFQDASIKEGTTVNGNWSKNEVYGNPDNPIVALVEFDISHLSGEQTLLSAIFRPYVRTLKDSKSSTFSIYSTGSQNWLQDSVTWNTRPTKGALLDSISINEKAVRVDFNVTQALQDAISDGKNKITFWIEDSEKEYESFEFDSVNKNPSYPNEPELVLYTDSENTSTGTGQQEDTSQGNNNALPVNTLIQGGRILQLLGTTVNEKDWNENSGGGILRADLGSLSDLDQSKPILYQWYVNGNPLIGATGNNISLGSYGLSEASLQLSASYTSSSGESLIVFSPIINYEDWRIYSGGESGNVSGDNPTPFFETYSFADSSRTHDGSGWFEGGYRASATHSITSVRAEEVGVPSLEGSNILKVSATSGSKRAELGNRNYNTRFQENQNAYIAAKIYLPKEEWDPVTQYSTIIFQHKQYPGADPNFEIRLSNEGDYKLYVRSYYGHYGLPKKGDVNYKHDHKTIATLTPNFWHDLKIHLTPSQDSESGQITIYLDGKVIFSGNGSNLNDKDNTNDSFLKLGMYTNIYDDRHFFLDAVEMTTYLPRSVADWVSSTPTDIDSPSFVSATASNDGSKIILTYSEVLSPSTAVVSDFNVSSDGTLVTIDSVSTSGSTIVITLDSALTSGQSVILTYSDPSSDDDSNAVQDRAGNDAASLNDVSVSTKSQEPFVQILGSNNQSTNNDKFDGCLYADIENIYDLDKNRTIDYQWFANDQLMPGFTDLALRGMKWSDVYQNKSFRVKVSYYPKGSNEKVNLVSDPMNWGNFYFYYGGEPGNGYQGTTNTEGVRDIIIMPDFQGNNPKALSSYLQYDPGLNVPSNENDRHFIKTVHQNEAGIAAREGTHLIEFSAKEISNRTELGTGDTHFWFYEGEDIYFGYSIYLPKEEWDPVTKYSTIITQLRQFGMHDGPNFGLRLSNKGDYKLQIESMLFEGYPYVATLGPDQWFDIKIHSKQSKGSDGEVNIWIDNQLVWHYEGRTMYYSDDAGYISFGMYTEIRDNRKFFLDAIEQTDHLYMVNSLEEWSQKNPSGDLTAPIFSHAEIPTSGNQVILHYNESLSNNVATTNDFSVVADTTAIEVNSVSTVGSTIVLSLTSKIDWDQEVTIAYTNSASNNNTNSIQDYAGNLAGNLSNTSVLNKSTQGIPDTTHPTIFISSDAKYLYKNQTATINFALSETSTNFDQSDVDIKGGTLTNWTKLTQSSYTATFTPTTNSMSTGVISVAENKFTDEAGNTNLVGDKETNILVLSINTIQNVHNELRILGTAEDRSGVRGVLYADIYGITDLDSSKSFSYQWLSNDTIIEGATSQTLDVGDYFSFIENKEVVVSLSYTTSSGQETSISSAPMPYEGFRIVANAENDRNEWLDYTVSEVVPNAANPYPLKESYSNNGTSSTSGTKPGSAHNIKAVNAADEGITARNGTNVIRIFADGSKSNRSELAHLNNETTFHPGEDYYFSGSFYPPKTEWDPVTEYSTVITQLKQYGGGDPNFELRLSNLGDYKMTWRGKPHGISYTDMGFAIPDEWNDLKIYAKHSQDSEGKFQVWLNNELVIDYTGPTMYRNAEGYLKFGMYTQIHDQRILYWDAIDISDHISTDFNTWLTSVSNKPSVNLNNNIDGQQFTDSKLLVISGSAIDVSGDQIGSAGGISSVKLFAGDELLDSVTESEFSFSNLNLADGEHNLRIVVTDNDNNTREESFSIWIGNKSAQVFIVSNDYLIGSFQTGSTVNLSANAYDEDGSIHEVKFFANGQLIGVGETIGEGRYSLNWVPADAGSYAIQAQATDNDGAVTISDSVAALVGDNTMTAHTLQAVQDVTIEEGSSTTGNWSKTEVYGSPSKAKIALVEFDLSRIESSKYIRSAIFKPYITKLQNSPGTFSIYLANSKIWSQSKVNWNNRPSKEDYLDTITINSTGTRIGFDVTAGLQKAKDAGQSKVTFWIEDSEKEYQRFDFASHDNDSISQPAELIVESGSISLPQAIEGSYSENQDNEDDLPPTVSISTDTTALRKGGIANLSFSLSKKSNDFTPSDIFVSGGTLSNFSGSGLFYSAEFIPGNDHKAEMIISVGSSKFSDANGNYNEDGTDSNNKVSILFDATTPDTTNETMSTTLIATQDASIKKGTDTNGNWGDIEIYGHPTNPIIALVEFDLSNLNEIAEVGAAFFRPYIQNIKDGSGSFDIYTTGTENWNETVVTWSTRPSKGVLLDSITINATGKRFDFDVTKSVQNAVLKDQKKITFWIEDSQQSYERTDFDSSRSDQAYPPELIVKGRSKQSVAFDDGFTEGNNTGVQNVIENPEKYNLFTEEYVNFLLQRDRSIYELKARKEGEDAVLQNPALYGLKSLDDAGKATPYTLEWFYEENLGWLYSNSSIFPYFFKSKKANEPSAWLYFDNGSYPPRFYNYNTEEWFELKK